MEKISNIERRNNSNKKIKQLGIACLETLPVIEDSTQVSLKDIDTICKRAIACLISTQLAIDISENNDYDSSKTFFLNMLKQYGVQDNLIEKEKRINPDTLIADLNPDVVVERRKGLEWLIANEEDWDEISLDT